MRDQKKEERCHAFHQNTDQPWEMTIAWIEFQHCYVDELAITFGNTSGVAASKVGFLHFKKCCIEGGGIQALTPIFLVETYPHALTRSGLESAPRAFTLVSRSDPGGIGINPQVDFLWSLFLTLFLILAEYACLPDARRLDHC